VSGSGPGLPHYRTVSKKVRLARLASLNSLVDIEDGWVKLAKELTRKKRLSWER
jgi:hypothetical protein